LTELVAWHQESARQLADLPEGKQVRVQVTYE